MYYVCRDKQRLYYCGSPVHLHLKVYTCSSVGEADGDLIVTQPSTGELEYSVLVKMTQAVVIAKLQNWSGSSK